MATEQVENQSEVPRTVQPPPAVPGAGNGQDTPVTGVPATSSPDFNRERDLAEEVRSGLQLFVVAVKNCALYPENSKIRGASLEKLQEWFAKFLDQHESLKLFVDMDSFLFQGVQVYQEKAGEGAVVFPFFRDGVQWIEFQEGMEPSELSALIDNMNRFRMLKEEDEDDLVTALWDADLQNIKYKTANEFWEIDPVTEIASFSVSVGQANAPKTENMTRKSIATVGRSRPVPQAGGKALGVLLNWMKESGRRQTQDSSLFPPESDLRPPDTGLGGDDSDSEGEVLEGGWRHQPWAISHQERLEMEKLLSDEAKRSHLGLGIDLTLALLVQHTDQDSQGIILKFLAEMVKFAFARGDFGAPILILGKLEGLIRSFAPDMDHLRTEFPRWLATEPVMEGLIALVPRQDCPEDDASWFQQFLSVLPADAGKILAATAGKARDPMVRTCLLASVADRAAAGGHDLGIFLNTALSPEDLSSLIELLKGRDLKSYVDLLTASARHVHKQVREAASRLLLERNTDYIASVPQLLNEPDPSLARQIYWQLSQRRSAVVEKTIMGYLTQTFELSVNRAPDQVLQAYRTLGLAAATPRAVAFASDLLMKKDFKALFGLENDIEKTHRAGAALALHFIPAQLGSQDILEQASRSFFRSLRAACAKASQEADTYRAMVRRE
jgi:hypothetical protein